MSSSPRVERAEVLPSAVTLSRQKDGVWTPDSVTLKQRSDLLADIAKFARANKTIRAFDLRGLHLSADLVLALSAYATQLSMLRVADCGDLQVSTLSPLLICNVGSRSLRVLDLSLSNAGGQRIDSLFTTLSACCPALVELRVSRGEEGGSYDDGVEGRSFYGEEDEHGGGGQTLWRTSVSAVRSVLRHCPGLSILGLEGMRFVEGDDEESSKADDDKNDDKKKKDHLRLHGVSLINCEYSLSFIELILTSHHLSYLEIVNAARRDYNDDPEEEVAPAVTPCAAELIDVVATIAGHSMKSLALTGFGVRDHDVLAISKGLAHLTRLSLGDSPLLLGKRSFDYLKTSGLLQKLNRLDLLSDNSDSAFKRSSASMKLEPGKVSGIGDEAIECFDDSNDLRELMICGIDVTPAVIARKLPHLIDLSVADCAAFLSPSEVCKLCRANENVVISEGDRRACSLGAFGQTFFDCYDEFGEVLLENGLNDFFDEDQKEAK